MTKETMPFDYVSLTDGSKYTAHTANLVVWLKRHRTAVALGAWALFSIYPTISYFSHRSTILPPLDALATVPAPASTPLPGYPFETLQDPLRPDYGDIFASYNRDETCYVSSLDLHTAFEPLCPDKESLLQAMSSGGRIGVDAPFSPRGCDMRWFTTAELCEIISRFSVINLGGDSLMRNLAVAANILLRGDLINGGVASWMDFSDFEKEHPNTDCSCAGTIEIRECVWHSVVNFDQVLENLPDEAICDVKTAGVMTYHVLTNWPIKQIDINGMNYNIPRERPNKPPAFIMGAGLWNKLNLTETHNWLEQVTNSMQEYAPWLNESGKSYPKLYLSPTAAGDDKPDIFIYEQGNIAVSRFEKAMDEYTREHDIDHIGMYNMSIQATSPDGTHGTMRTNLIKAMMVFNWLDSIDVSTWN